MAFWKKSEDPWDWDPSKKRPEPRPAEPQEPRENPLDSLKQWNEERKAKAKEREEAKWLPPEKCPWCGKEMEQGYMLGGRGSVSWYPGIYKTDFLRGVDAAGRIDVQDEGGIWSGLYKTTWLCRDCKKAVFTMPDPPEVLEPYDALAHLTKAPGKDTTQEEEESGD